MASYAACESPPQSGWPARRRAAALCACLGVSFLAAAQAPACGFHGFGFSPFASQQMHSSRPTLPAGTRLEAPGFLAATPGIASKLPISFSAPDSIAEPSLTVEGPVAVSFEDSGELPVMNGDGSLSLAFTATEGYHWLTVTLRGTVDGEDTSLVRRVYVIARGNKEVAAR